jgi:hypothetical protein
MAPLPAGGQPTPETALGGARETRLRSRDICRAAGTLTVGIHDEVPGSTGGPPARRTMPAKMANDLIPFMLTGTISSWDVNTRVVYLGRTCLKFAPGVPLEVLPSHQSVTVPGTGGSTSMARGW